MRARWTHPPFELHGLCRGGEGAIYCETLIKEGLSATEGQRLIRNPGACFCDTFRTLVSVWFLPV